MCDEKGQVFTYYVTITQSVCDVIPPIGDHFSHISHFTGVGDA